MTDAEILDAYGSIIWREVEKDRDRDRHTLLHEIDAIIEAGGAAPFNWSHAPEGVAEYAARELPAVAAAAVKSRADSLEQLSEYSRMLYERTDRCARKRRAAAQ